MLFFYLDAESPGRYKHFGSQNPNDLLSECVWLLTHINNPLSVLWYVMDSTCTSLYHEQSNIPCRLLKLWIITTHPCKDTHPLYFHIGDLHDCIHNPRFPALLKLSYTVAHFHTMMLNYKTNILVSPKMYIKLVGGSLRHCQSHYPYSDGWIRLNTNNTDCNVSRSSYRYRWSRILATHQVLVLKDSL